MIWQAFILRKDKGMPARIADLPCGIRAMTPTMNDIGRATEFFNLVEISEWGVPDFDESEVEEEWADLDLEKSVVVVEDESGQIVASMTLILSDGVTWGGAWLRPSRATTERAGFLDR